MKLLEDMTIGQRIVLTFIVVLVILLAMAIAGFVGGWWEEAPAAPLANSPFDQILAELDHEALDEAYRVRVMLLYTNWLNDPTEQPKRMLLGIEKARAAYTQALTEILKREKQQP